MRWALIFSRSVRFAIRFSVSRCCVRITMSAQSVDSTCGMITPLLDLKPRILNGSSLAGEIPNGLALCAIHHKAFDKGSIGLDENMRLLVSEAVNGNGIVGRLFWDFAGKQIALPMVKGIYPREGFVEWHRKEVFRK